jgi:hypothetical protein
VWWRLVRVLWSFVCWFHVVLVGEYQSFGGILLPSLPGLFDFITERGRVVNITTVCTDVSDTSNNAWTSIPFFPEIGVTTMHQERFELCNIRYTSIENGRQNINWCDFCVFHTLHILTIHTLNIQKNKTPIKDLHVSAPRCHHQEVILIKEYKENKASSFIRITPWWWHLGAEMCRSFIGVLYRVYTEEWCGFKS